MATTLREIAQEAGVSIQTVSRILRGQYERHHEATCQRVLQAADRLNYRPNLLGRALQSGKTHSVGMIRLGMGEHISTNIYGMIREAREHQYQLLLTMEDTWLRDNDKRFLQIVDDLLGRQVDGLIIHRGVPLEPSTQKYMASLKVPVIYMSWAPAGPCHRVDMNRAASFRRLLDHLISMGHKRLAYFPSPGALDYPGHGIHPAQRMCQEKGLLLDTVTPDKTFNNQTPEEHWAYASVKKYLSQAQSLADRATAMVFPSFYTVHGGMLALQDAGLRVPDDFSVVAMEESPLHSLVKPGITAVRNDWESYGRMVFKTMYRLIVEPSEEPVNILLPTDIIFRQSVGPAPTRDAKPPAATLQGVKPQDVKPPAVKPRAASAAEKSRA